MKYLLIALSFTLVLSAMGQDEGVVEYVEKTFNSSMGLNFQTLETSDKGNLSFHLGHRFGRVDGGYLQFYGLDQSASWRLAFDYGLTDLLTVGIARSGLDNHHEGYFKYRIIRQSKGAAIQPVSLTLLGRVGLNGDEWRGLDNELYTFKHRMTYSFIALIGRKFTDKLAMQVFPMVIHKNLTRLEVANNTIYGLGSLIKYKFSRVGSVVIEYAHNLNYESIPNDYYGNFAVGLDFTTFSHNFSLMLTNTVYMVGDQSIPLNNGNFFDQEIHIGFNITRRFIL